MSKNKTIIIYCIYNAEGSIIGELNGKAPCVVAKSNKSFKFIFTNDELISFRGDAQKFFKNLDMKAKLILSQ